MHKGEITPSPGKKRFKARYEAEEAERERIEEEERQEEMSFKFNPGTLPDVIYIGKEKTFQWSLQSLKT